MEEIVNRIAKSGIITIDLDLYFPQDPIIPFDIKDWLWQGLVLKEKDFRERLEIYDWESFRNTIVTIYCSADAIVPFWAFMLLAVKLEPVAKELAYGTSEQYLAMHYSKELSKLNPLDFKDKRVIIKGCGDYPVPVSSYVEITTMLRPYATSIMYGEPCSTVPVYKRKPSTAS
jgi:hypothetical protein